MKKVSLWTIIKETVQDWSADKASRLAAALSYYTLFSIAPLFVILIAIIGMIIGSQSTVQSQIHTQISNLMGTSAADTINGMISNTNKGGAGIFATIVGVVLLLLGASGLFGELQDSLNTIWNVKQAPGQGFMATLKNRVLSFGMVLVIGFLLLVSFVVSTALSVLGTFFQGLLPGPGYALLFQVLNIVVSLLVVTLLFGLIYKVLPDVDISWKDVWVGGLVTALLFTVGKYLISLYLARSTTTSAYGAAGSLVVILLWVYYSAQILFLGAEFTQVYARHYGKEIVPTRGAVRIGSEERAGKGLPPKTSERQPARAPSGASGNLAYATIPVTGEGQPKPVTGDQGNRPITMPMHRRYPQNAELGGPPMPTPVKVFLGVAGALLGVLGVQGAMMARSKQTPEAKRLVLESRRMLNEANRLRTEAKRMKGQGSRVRTAASLMRSMGTRLEDEGERIQTAGKHIEDQAKHSFSKKEGK
jgi:membrane protein